MASVSKEFHRLLKRVGKVTDGQASIADIDWDDGELKNFYVTIIPNNGYYKGGRFKFEVKILDEYPVEPPVVWCHTDIYHPNIDPTEENYSDSSTNVCLNVLESGTWSSSFGLEGAILGLLFLMHNPNLQDPLSPHFEGGGDEEYFQENVKKYMAGEEFDDLSFDKDFKVIDGILIDDTVQSTESESNSEVIMVENVENLKNSDDSMNTTDTNSKVTADDMTDKCALNDKDVSKTVNTVSEIMENNDRTQNSCGELNEGEIFSDVAGNTNEQDQSLEHDIELVNINGDCVLLIHKYDSTDNEIAQETDYTTMLTQNESVTENSASGNQNSQNEVSNSDNIETNTEGNNSTASNNACNIAEVKNEGSTSSHGESDIKTVNPDSDPDIHDKDNCRHDKNKSVGCGVWYSFRIALSKIVHSIVHNKLYRDIGF